VRASEIPEAHKKLSVYLTACRDHFALPELSVGMVVDGGRLETFDAAHRVASPRLFKIGSLTKLVTALAVLKLQERGDLRLDDPVAKHLNWFDDRADAKRGKPITILDLMRHTAGLPRGDYFVENPSTSQVMVLLQSQARPLFPDAAHAFKYSNLAYVVLGLLIEGSSREAFATFIERYIFAPLGMVSAGFGAASSTALTTPHRLSCFSPSSRTAFDFTEMRLQSAPHASHDMHCTVSDFSRLLACLLNDGVHDGQRVFAGTSIASLWQNTQDVGNRARAGMAFHMVSAFGGNTVFESAEHLGHSASMLLALDRNFGLVAMTNRGSAGLSLTYILSTIARFWLRPGAMGQDPLEHTYRDTSALLGAYRADGDETLELRIRQTRGALRMSVGDHPAVQIGYIGQERFKIPNGIFAKYLMLIDRNHQGVRGLCIGPRYFRRCPVSDATPVVPARHGDKAGIYTNPEAGRVAVFERNHGLILAFSPFKEARLDEVAHGVFVQQNGPYEREQVVFRAAGLSLGRLQFTKTDEHY